MAEYFGNCAEVGATADEEADRRPRKPVTRENATQRIALISQVRHDQGAYRSPARDRAYGEQHSARRGTGPREHGRQAARSVRDRPRRVDALDNRADYVRAAGGGLDPIEANSATHAK